MLPNGGIGGSFGGRGGGANAIERIGEDIFLTPSGYTSCNGSSGLPETVYYGPHPPYWVGTISFETGPGDGGYGAGIIWLVAEQAVIDGTITVNGGAGGGPKETFYGYNYAPNYYTAKPGHGGGGGSGGEIRLIVKDLHIGPTACIQANGGMGGPGYGKYYNERKYEWDGYPGGGGRIKIFYETGEIHPDAIIEARAGQSPSDRAPYPAENGSVYIQQLKNVMEVMDGPKVDLNGDGKVDAADMIIMQQQWGATYTTTPSSTPQYTPGGLVSGTHTPIPVATATAEVR